MPNSEEIGAKEALEMIIRGQIGELLFRRVKVEPDWADVHWRAVDTLRDRGAKTEVLCSDGKWRPYVGFVGSAKQLGELGMGNKLRYRVDQNTIPIKVREEPVFTSSPTATVSIETGPVQVLEGESVGGKATVDVRRKDPELSLDEGNRVTVKLAPGKSVRKGQCVTSSNLEKFGVSVNWGPGTVIDEKPKSLRAKVDARVSATVIGGAQMADPKDWFFALIDVLDEERAQSGQSRPVGKDRGIE